LNRPAEAYFSRGQTRRGAGILAVFRERPVPRDNPFRLTWVSMEQYLEFVGNHTLLVGGLVFSFFLLVFTELRRKALGVSSVEPQDAVKLINNDAVVIDLRSAEAFARGHIVNAKNIPFDELAARGETLDKFKSRAIVAVCEAGTTSGKAVQLLQKAGIQDVYGLRGGIAAWTQANLPLVTSKRTRKKS
jgi:rhodanese-related sulfurtransferase